MSDIIRHDDGSLTVPVEPGRDDADTEDGADATVVDAPTSIVIRPGEGGYVEALAEWEADQHPDRGEAVSTASGRAQAMSAVHAVGEDEDHLAQAIDALDDPQEAAEALRHVLVGGNPSVEAFAAEVAEAEGGEPLPAHTVTSIIGNILAETDERAD
ncbi:MAG: hypothetical protein ABJH68_12970 [Ilumatobacter sp.]|uniref:hypothetical protein n=1 Tax=Ilumatobacter sp. TaxID=1967498 RepID=UPI0032996FD1